MYTYVPSLVSLPPTPHPFPPASRLLQSLSLSSLSHTENFHWLSILHIIVYMLPCYSLHSYHPLLPLPAMVIFSREKKKIPKPHRLPLIVEVRAAAETAIEVSSWAQAASQRPPQHSKLHFLFQIPSPLAHELKPP